MSELRCEGHDMYLTIRPISSEHADTIERRYYIDRFISGAVGVSTVYNTVVRIMFADALSSGVVDDELFHSIKQISDSIEIGLNRMSGGRAGCVGLIIPLKMEGAKAGPLPQNTRRFVHEFADASEDYSKKIRELLASVGVIGDPDDPTIAESVATFTQLATIVESVTDTIRTTHPE
jgi:hypothetical protein